jgi:cell division protein FtsI/penicillin-binding protein 2
VQNELITPQIELEYLKKFGFWQPVDTDGVEEATGTLNFNTPADKASLSYGQGSSVTTLQLHAGIQCCLRQRFHGEAAFCGIHPRRL